MKIFLYILLFFSQKIVSQKIFSKNEIFAKDSLVYEINSNQLFTGIIQNYAHKNHWISEIEFLNGILKKSGFYYNGKEQIVSDEIYYFGNNKKIQKKIKYSLDHNLVWIKHFDKKGFKILEEEFKDNILTYSCPFSNNKKNGVVFSLNKKGEKNECEYINGNYIKK